MLQEPEFAACDKGYTFVSHQQEVGAGYFDDVSTVIPATQRIIIPPSATRVWPVM